MAGAKIDFTDGIGATSLDNGMGAVAGAVGARFANWVSESTPIGAARTALGTGARAMFTFRTDYTATFELQDIPNANVTIVDRLIAWLLAGGTVSVTCADSGGAVFATCGLAEGSTPKKTMFNKTDQTWAVSLKLVNLAASPAAMTCVYT